MTIETFTRPFASPEVTPPRRFIQPGQAGAPNVILNFGRSGAGKVMNGHFNLRVTFYCDKHVNETSNG